MNTTNPTYHTAPLVHLVKQVLWKGAPLEERVRAIRKRRRKTGPTPGPSVSFDEGPEANPPMTKEEWAAIDKELSDFDLTMNKPTLGEEVQP